MMRYIDIQSHLLPGIDDGAKNLEMSMEMFHIAAGNGIGQMILTPHNKPMHKNAGPAKIESMIQQLRECLKKEKIDIQLHAGNELYYRSDVLEELDEGKALTMAGSGYVLTEFGPMDDYEYIRRGIYKIMAGGYRPILAHVERYGSVCAKAERVEDLIAMGCYIQVNAGSIMGQYGFQTKVLTRRLLKQRLVHFVATDAHNTEKRSPAIYECAKYIEKKYGQEFAERLLIDNPMRVINDEYI